MRYIWILRFIRSVRLPLKMAGFPDSKELAVHPLLLFAVMLVSFTLTVWYGGREPEAGAPPLSGHSYTYQKLAAKNGVALHAIRTSPRNIGLKAISENVTDTRDNGINGGFFWQGHLLSIAVMNGKPVKGEAGDYGSGWYNTDRPRGTLVWDEAAGQFSVQIAEASDQLKVTDRNRFWAQGGVSMGLKNEQGWKAQALAEEFPAMEENRLRSGMVYDADGQVWLLVSETACTGGAFRRAVQETVGAGRLVDGIFLDGDGSSQLQLGKLQLAGDKRTVYQMITLKGA